MISPAAVVQHAIERFVNLARTELVWGESDSQMPGPTVRLHLRGHAHNDEMQRHPLVQALQAGLGSIEADVHLIDGKLLVGHDRPWAKVHGLGLEELYLAPLVERVTKYGAVYRGGPPVTLLLDFKTNISTDAAAIYAALQPLLAKYHTALTHYDDGKKVQGPINVVITGGQPSQVVDQPGIRWIALDGQVADLLRDPGAVSPEKTPMVNGNFKAFFQWNGTGPMVESEQARLKQMVVLARQRGVRLRLWDAPDNPTAWSLLEDAGVDYINTDKLQDFAQWQDKAGHGDLPSP